MEGNRMNPLNTVKWPLIIGFVLAVVIAALVEGGLTFNAITWRPHTLAAHHCSAGSGSVCCITSTRYKPPPWPWRPPTRADPGGAGVNNTSRRAPCCGFDGRRSLTWLFGALSAVADPWPFRHAFTLACSIHPVSRSNVIIGIGAWLGTIMLFNVWGLIWPNQKKILGIVPATDEQKAKAARSRYTPHARISALHPHADVHDRSDARTPF